MKFYFKETKNIIQGHYIKFKDESILFNPSPSFDDSLQLNDIAYELCLDTKNKKVLTFMGYSFGFKKGSFTVPNNYLIGEIKYDISDNEFNCPNFTPIGYYRDDGWFMVGDDTKDSQTYMIAQNTLISLSKNNLTAIYFKI